MPRPLTVAAAQLGPIADDEPRASAVARMIALMEKAHRRGVELVVFPEAALTAFFPHWYMEDQAAIDRYFETEMPSAETQPLFDKARELGIAFHLGYAEIDGEHRYNTAILVGPDGTIVSKYRKVHLPGYRENEPWRPFQNLEKRYFERGNLGFPVVDALGGRVGLCICNDRRWPEVWRILGLQNAELVLLGYNTPQHDPASPAIDHLQDFHNHLSLQAGAYQNGTYVVATAKAGLEEGCEMIGGSCIVAPTGEIIAVASTRGDELVVADIDLDRCKEIRSNIFNFTAHRQPDLYTAIAEPMTAARPAPVPAK
ncbi:N-carbamoyl-D-amino-acid hydrolase [Acuticoccus sediminis]|uniref:N-carbamoyl-D-amino-acid hydrolase n=1 Tax=Acuticoccus sediminis TaxID=2184697 RepID=A0A8B2NUQ0_9HYPH|nr:N-carbamoyl-D-amino-acid hydrolase [Acuticoccus sediminis]RAI02018.1 N-carbamoyl-D-amino-acid hydrolase [Acuticoccus sediminis]